ncbi:hypothetical protein FACS1894120_3230 [Clostridia bacterium]|nr:hypothetical protein FACS1894120_3230 [Clostridia bacterium]
MLSNIKISDRLTTEITGVKEITPQKPDDRHITVITSAGELKLRGENLNITRVDISAGIAEITGKVYALSYSDNTERIPDNFITRLFK